MCHFCLFAKGMPGSHGTKGQAGSPGVKGSIGDDGLNGVPGNRVHLFSLFKIACYAFIVKYFTERPSKTNHTLWG